LVELMTEPKILLLQARRDDDPMAALERFHDSPEASDLLRRFVELVW
jgi:hypothetical protein